MIQDALAEFKHRDAGCELVILADVSAGTILATVGQIRHGQEHLDGLCEAAQATLTAATGEIVSSVIEASPVGYRLFVRSARDPDAALLALFSPASDLTGAVAAAEDCLAHHDTQAREGA